MIRVIQSVVAVLCLSFGPLTFAAASSVELNLDGAPSGPLSAAEGGAPVGQVVIEPLGPDQIAHKHIAGVKYDDLTMSFGVGLTGGLYDWLKSSFDHKATRKSGAIVAADYNFRITSQEDFNGALIAEIGFPALDAASKDAAKMTVKLSPDRTLLATTPSGKGTGLGARQKAWLCSNFRLKIDGLDAATSRVNKIEAITVKQKIIENPVGEGRDAQKEPANLEYPNLMITLPETYAQPLYDWHQAFVIQGKNGAESEKTGTLEFLAPDNTTVFFTLNFSGLGIIKVSPDKLEAGSDGIRRVKAELYVEEIKFTYAPTALASASHVIGNRGIASTKPKTKKK